MPESLVPFVLDRKWGYLDANGKVVIEPRFGSAEPFSDGLAWITTGEATERRWGAIDAQGNPCIPERHEVVFAFHEGRARVLIREGGREVFRFVRADGDWVSGTWDTLSDIRDGVALASTAEGRSGVVDRDGAWVLEPRYELTALQPFSHGLAACREDGKWGYIDLSGAWVVEPRFERAGPFGPRVAPVSLGGRLVLVDRAGETVAATLFAGDELHAFTADLLLVRIRSRYGWIDHHGRIAIEPELGWAGDFVGEVAMAGNDPLSQGLIDRRGVFLIPPRFYAVVPTGAGLARVYPDEMNTEMFGYTTHSGVWVWAPPGMPRHWNVAGQLPGCGQD